MATTLVKSGEIVLLDLNPKRGGEKGKIRPCLVLAGSGHPWGIIIVVPITDAHGKRPSKLFVPIAANKSTGLSKASVVDCFQIRCVSEDRIVKSIGAANDPTLSDVRTRVAVILDIGEEHVGTHLL